MNRINKKDDGKPCRITALDQLLINLALDEYKSLRTEVVNSVDRQYSLANWGISAIAVLTAALINGWDKLLPLPNVMAFVIMFAVPAIVTSYATAWSHVISKIAQLGERLHEIEENIASAIHEDNLRTTYRIKPGIKIDPFHYLLGWEHKLWRG